VITKNPLAVQALRVVIIGIVFLGATAPAATSVVFFSDPMMGILALVNLVVIMMLLPTCLRVLNDFRKQLKAGIERPIFNPDDFPDLDLDRTAWTGRLATEDPVAEPKTA
jgi:AGCS family alanine or glycine:cation symporter